LLEKGFVFSGGIDMRSSCLVAISLYLMGATVVLAQTPQRTEGPGLKAQEDSRYKAEIAMCKNYHPVIRNFGAAGGQPPPAGPPAYEGPAAVQAIPGVIAAGAHWRSVWHESGNNADGIVATPDGVLVAQQDTSDVVLVNAAGHVKVVYKDTDTGGAVSINRHGQTFIVERGLHQAIWEVSPDRKMLADTIDGDSLDCLGSGGLNDLTAAANGGVYFTLGDLYYVAPRGTITRQGDVTGTNGIILSPDEKRLYVTSGGFGRPGNLVVFDVQPDGMLMNERVFAHLTGGGDGSTVDSADRIYVSSGTVIDVISPDDGHLLGVIPLPKGDDVISLTFGGPGKRTLYAVALNHKYAKGGLGLPSDHLMGGQGGELVAIRMLAHGYAGRAK
jgi:sugar lactone lactonase YvrE